MSRIRLLCSLVWLVVGSTVVMSQTPSAFLDKFEAEVLHFDKGFKLSQRTICSEFTAYEWELGEQHGDLELKVKDSEAAASHMLTERVRVVPVGQAVRLKGLGDEAYLIQSRSRPLARIMFRSGRVYAEIWGPSSAVESVARAVRRNQ